METLTALDATFLELEELDHGALMSIGGTMVFEPRPDGSRPDVEGLRCALAARLDELPRYLQRLSSARTGGLSWPHWEADPRFDVRNHVRHAALPQPGSETQLCDWTAEFFSHPLDRTRPLWEIVLIEGLEDGRWALAHKTHHCLVDGVGSVDVVGILLDEEPGRRPRAPVGANDSSTRGRSPRAPEAIVQATRAGARAAGAGVHAVTHPKDAFHRSRAAAELVVRDELIGAPRTSLNVPIGQARRFAVVRASLAELKAIGHSLGGSLNDAALAACAAGFRSLLLARGEEPPSRGLRAMVPVNIRSDSSDGIELGNRVSSLFVELPVAEDDGRARLQRIVDTTRRLKASGAADGAAMIIDVGAIAPPAAHRAALARTEFSTRLFNVTITNVPGSPRPLYALGAPLREVYPVVPLAAEHAVGVAIFSYNGLVTFGINADRDSTPDLDVLATGIAQGIDQLRALVPKSKRGRRRAANRTRRPAPNQSEAK